MIEKIGSKISILVWNDLWISANRPRPTTYKENNFILPWRSIWRSWCEIQSYLTLSSFKLIFWLSRASQNIQSKYAMLVLTKSQKYTVKSRYWTENKWRSFGSTLHVYWLDFRPLQAHTLDTKISPKLWHFIWQVITVVIGHFESQKQRRPLWHSVCMVWSRRRSN